MITIGPVIPGRTSRLFSPLQANLIAWWVADDIVGSEAAAWPDRSGQGNNLTQGTASARLAVVDPDPDFNGHKSVQGASGDFIRGATLVQGTLAQPYTKYAVIKLPAAWGNNQHFFSGAVNATTRGDMFCGASGNLSAYAGSVLTASGVVVGAAGIMRVAFDGAATDIRWIPFSGSEITASGNAGSQSLEGVCLMGFATGLSTFTGKMADALHVAGDVRDTPGLDGKIVTYLLNTYRP